MGFQSSYTHVISRKPFPIGGMMCGLVQLGFVHHRMNLINGRDRLPSRVCWQLRKITLIECGKQFLGSS
jgi:hypothetical protein